MSSLLTYISGAEPNTYLWNTFGLKREGITVSQMPVQYIHLVIWHGVDHAINVIYGNVIPGSINHQSSHRICWSIFNMYFIHNLSRQKSLQNSNVLYEHRCSTIHYLETLIRLIEGNKLAHTFQCMSCTKKCRSFNLNFYQSSCTLLGKNSVSFTWKLSK